MEHVAPIAEIFSSLQGEGPYTGEPTLFVRFAHCRLGCQWCDTQHNRCDHTMCRIAGPDGETIMEAPNPLTVTALNEIIASYAAPMLSVTGGEPLEQAGFLVEWLPSVRHRFTVLLETNGVMWEEMAGVAELVHIVSMDIKLPSSAGCRPLWKEHELFLRTALAANREVYAKIVVTERTSDRDVQDAIRLITQINKFIAVIIQPATPTLTFHDVISRQRLDSIDRLCRAYLPNVRVAEQMHKRWNIP